MKHLLVETSFPQLANDISKIQNHIEISGELPEAKSIKPPLLQDANMWYALFLMLHDRHSDAARHIDSIVFDETSEALPPLYLAWMWLVRMSIFIEDNDYMLALGAAENALNSLVEITGKKSDVFLAIVASLLYNLACVHNGFGDNSRAAKELTHAQKIFERLVKKDDKRYSPMLVYSIEASTLIFKSRLKQMNAFAHYQSTTELYTSMLTGGGDKEDTRQAIEILIDSLKKEGDIMLQMGNGRNAVKYYTKALRYQKKVSNNMGYKELVLSIGLAKGLMRLVNRRSAAEQLLNSLLPLAQRLEANDEVIEIENLLNNKNKNFNIMSLLKSIFTIAILFFASLTMNAQLIVGHRGSIWGVENTRAAFINGAKAGAWGLECDIHTTKDGAFIICHDGNMKRLGGPETGFTQMNVRDVLATPLIQERKGVTYVGGLLTLAEYLDLCNEYKVVPVIEIKAEECYNIHSDSKNPANNNFEGVPAFIDLLTRKGLADKAVIISFMPETIEYIHKNYPKMNVQVLAGDGTTDDWVKWCKKRHIDLDAESSLVTPEAVAELHKAGLKVNAWTVDNPDVLEKMKAAGCDFITTNVNFPKKLN
jgi:glycerophosphoryl diester phosphodiesterase